MGTRVQERKRKKPDRGRKKEQFLSVIIPLYNEVDNITPLFQRLNEVLPRSGVPFEVLFINDGSQDGTDAALEKIVSGDGRFKVFHLHRNCGQTAAMMAGIDHARGDILIPMDGDLQNDPVDIGRLLEKLEEGYDVVSGWRKERKDNPFVRNLPSFFANKLISFISGVKLHDYGCSLKAYRREVIKDVRLYGEMHRFIPIYASWQGARVTEIPVTHHPRRAGKSKYGLNRTVKVILDLIVVKFLADYSQKPIYLFGGFGILNFFIAFLVFLWMLYLKYFAATNFNRTPLPALSVIFVVTGIQSIFIGLIAELLVRTYYESQNKSVYKLKNFTRED